MKILVYDNTRYRQEYIVGVQISSRRAYRILDGQEWLIREAGKYGRVIYPSWGRERFIGLGND